MIRSLAYVFGLWSGMACAEPMITGAAFDDPTKRYAHGILGDAVEWGKLRFNTANAPGDVADAGESWAGRAFSITLPEDHVFEDVWPRLWDVTGDGLPEMVVVETDVTAGSALAIYNHTGKLAETPHIGQPNRWLAPIAAADLDGDGQIEIAYIDRPHLAKTLRVWRFADGALVPVADFEGLTNHRIGEADIGGGLRDCGDGPELITANADWSQVMATTLRDGVIETRPIGAHVDRGSFATALDCAPLP
ncbi:FG-GAP repeat domain-containing protein [Yoonia sp. SS1-5]|uniref:FG-GAP repeat domain-containing protein n=1 Tax=Yoonia rhodophyticola TaxID=3137370 RepID=A0AAN0MDX6_9RHOB